MIPCYLGSQLAVAYFLSSKVTSTLVNSPRNKFWKLILLGLLSSGIVSCAIVSQAGTWWNNLTDPYNRQLSLIINSNSRPLIIEEITNSSPRYNVFNLISLSYLLEPKVQFKFIADRTVPEIPKGFSDIFFFGASDVLKAGIQKKYNAQINPVSRDGQTVLLKLAKQ
jgi:hypothetical protein